MNGKIGNYCIRFFRVIFGLGSHSSRVRGERWEPGTRHRNGHRVGTRSLFFLRLWLSGLDLNTCMGCLRKESSASPASPSVAFCIGHSQDSWVLFRPCKCT